MKQKCKCGLKGNEEKGISETTSIEIMDDIRDCVLQVREIERMLKRMWKGINPGKELSDMSEEDEECQN